MEDGSGPAPRELRPISDRCLLPVPLATPCSLSPVPTAHSPLHRPPHTETSPHTLRIAPPRGSRPVHTSANTASRCTETSRRRACRHTARSARIRSSAAALPRLPLLPAARRRRRPARARNAAADPARPRARPALRPLAPPPTLRTRSRAPRVPVRSPRRASFADRPSMTRPHEPGASANEEEPGATDL